MGSESPRRLPIIDFSELGLKSSGSPQWDSVKFQVQQAVEEYGCFEALFDKVPLDLRKAILSSVEEFSDLPLQTKLQYVCKIPFLGYVGQIPQAPLYESIGIDDAVVHEKAKTFTEIFWPEGNPSFCNTIESFSNQVSGLDLIVRRMVLESLGVENYYDEHKESTNYMFRLIKYKGPQTTEKKHGLKPHTDKSIVTILYQNQVEGLEVQTKDGEWISVNPTADSFTVMIGDFFHAWTNGRLHSAKHRVMITGNEARYSVGLFSMPKEGYIIKAPKELIDDEHPLLFKPFDYVKFFEFYYTEAGLKAESSALKAFCGV